MEEKEKHAKDKVLPEKVYCSECSTETYHIIQTSYEVGNFIPPKSKKGRSQDSREAYIVAQCRGCEAIAFVRGEGRPYRSYKEAPNLSYENVLDGPEYPSRYEYLDSDALRMLPRSIEKLYKELSSNFESENQVMAGIALRILVEKLCRHREIPGKTLHKMIDGLVEKGLIVPKAAEALHKLRDIGNAAAHEAKAIKWDSLDKALRVLNACLKSIYVDQITHKTMVGVKTAKKSKPANPNNQPSDPNTKE